MANDVAIGHGPAFPVAFFDGEREMDVGDVRINPAMEYKSFQLMLSKMIGISPNQISIYLVNLKRNWRSPFADDRRRVPVTGKANFSAICRQKECRFLVILKRSRKSRIRRESMISGGDFIDFVRRSESSPAPQHLILLRRSQPASVYHRVLQSEAEDLSGRLCGIGVEGDAKSPFLDGDSLEVIEGNGEMKSCCEDCRKEEKNGGTTSFHHCIYDAVISQFTTRLGPINRPNKCF